MVTRPTSPGGRDAPPASTMRTSTPGRGSPTDPRCRPPSPRGTAVTAPNSVMPYPHRTSAPGSPAPKRRSVAVAIGALPTLTTARLPRSAVPKRGDPTMSSTIAGTRKAATGRSRSTRAIQRSGSKRGRNHPLSPPRRGPHTRSDPLVVANGEHEMKPRPSQAVGTRSRVESPRCGTTTPFGRPVVPEVYITSATSSGPSAIPRSRSSAARRSDQRRAGPGPVQTTVRTAERTSSTTSLQRTIDAPASRRIRASSTGASRASSGTATAPALWMAT